MIRHGSPLLAGRIEAALIRDKAEKMQGASAGNHHVPVDLRGFPRVGHQEINQKRAEDHRRRVIIEAALVALPLEPQSDIFRRAAK